ncbi:hypothetical protein M0R45_035932 [Rubus argutus]|uniref:Uncharacterized protein n=1 Tax=Rubus argutus TaxID=59490 RepID=A0AAW1VYA3_RUBAR
MRGTRARGQLGAAWQDNTGQRGMYPMAGLWARTRDGLDGEERSRACGLSRVAGCNQRSGRLQLGFVAVRCGRQDHAMDMEIEQRQQLF